MKTYPSGCARRNVWRQWSVAFAAIVALFQSAVGRTDQESPPRAPAVNDPHPWNYELKDWSFEVTNRSHVPSAFEIKDWSFEVTNRSHVPSAFEIKDWSFEVYCLSRGGKLEPLFGAPRVNEATGELFVEYIDLVIPGRGLDLVWGRIYRSKIGMDTAMGVGWDFSYNIRAALSGSNIIVQDGQNRTDIYFLQSDGSYSTDELFRRGTLSEKVFTLEFADKTRWIFKPLNGSPTSGKIDKIIDRNSNQIQFQYDGAGRLFLITDSLSRPFQISYDGANRIQAVQDFAGRTIQYQHLTSPTPGFGDVGDLVLVRSQAVTGTPIGNDFPSGKTAQFTYSTGLGGARDHNLLTARDGNNVQWFQAIYTTSAVATDFLYDRVASEIAGIAGERKVFTYLAKPSSNSRSNTATKTIVNDAIGNVHESLFDLKNRLIDLRGFTGRSIPGVPVTETTNRPINPVRPTDPAFFKTTIDWNRDSLPTRVMFPRGNGVEMIYQRDFDLATNPRERGNLRTHRQLPVSGAPLVQRFEYASGFGTGERAPLAPQFNFGFEKTFFDTNGDVGPNHYIQALNVCNMVDYIDEDVSSSHYCVQYRESDFDFSSRLIGLQCRVEDYLKLGDGIKCKAGPIVVDWDGDGIKELGIYNHVGFGTSSTDARGFTWTCARDANGNVMSVTRPDGVMTDVEHNANGQLTAIVHPQNHTGHRERDEWHYYSGGAQNGYLQSFIRDAGGLNLTIGFTHNSVGCVTQIVDPRGRDTQFFVNQLNQVVQVTSRNAALSGPAIRYLTNIYRDANNRITSIDVQNKNEFGTVGANAFFTTSFGYDSLDYMTSMTREVTNSHTVTTQYFYDPIRELIEVQSPLAVLAVQPDARVQYVYDERRLPFIATAAPGSGIATGSSYTYDENGNLTKKETGAPAGPHHVMTAGYDGFDRVISLVDAVGTQTQLGYNANRQLTQRTVTGSFLDNAGSPTTGMLASTSWIYASTGVCAQRLDSFFDIVSQLPLSDGARTTTYSYDPALNRTGVTDDNNHTTQCGYDGANRLSRITDPKGNHVDYTYNENGDVVASTRTDKSDTAAPDQVFSLTNVYDGLDRLITSTDNIGNVSSCLYDSRGNRVRYADPRNNLTQYQYDGINRLLRSGRDMNANSSGFDAGTDIISGRVWDDNSRLMSASDPNSHATQYQYDALGRLTQRTNADTTFKTWSYDAWGNAIQTNDENGTICINMYDALNRLKQRQVTAGAGVSTATTLENYDFPGRYLRPERAINDAAVVRYTYDSLGRLTSERLGNRITSYTHDGVGNLLNVGSPGGRVLTYAYDPANLCIGFSLTATSDGDSLGAVATCNYIGRRVEATTYRNGTSTSYTYDGFVGAPPSSDLGWGQLAASATTGPGPTVIDQRTFTYDAAGNLSERNDTRVGGPQLLYHYDYDAANRNVHTQVNAPGPTFVRDTIYNYDLNGNRIAVNGFNTSDAGSYFQDNTTPSPADAQMNQYTSTPLGNYSYDANGNRTNLIGGSANTKYKYDYANRLIDLTNVNTGQRIANYQYDALGRRIRKTLDPDGTPNITNFLYTGRSVLEERDGGGAVVAAYCFNITDITVFETDINLKKGGGAGAIPASYTSDLPPKEEMSLWNINPNERGEMCDDNCSSQREYCVQYRESDFDFASRLMEEEGIYYYMRSMDPGLNPPCSLAPVEMRRGGTNSTYHAEVVPWLWLMTNTSGGAAERYDYEDFGDPHVFSGAGGPLPSTAVGNPYLFKGMRFDAESGLYLRQGDFSGYIDVYPYMFDPKIGASLQREPSHAVNGWRNDSLNTYCPRVESAGTGETIGHIADL